MLLLFRASHQLEHRLTEKAAGGLQRLFDSVPDRAVVVEVEAGSNAPKVASSQEVREEQGVGATTKRYIAAIVIQHRLNTVFAHSIAHTNLAAVGCVTSASAPCTSAVSACTRRWTACLLQHVDELVCFL